MTSRVSRLCLLMVAAVLAPTASADQDVIRGVDDKVDSVKAWCVFGYNPGALANVCYSVEQTESTFPAIPYPEKNGEICLIGSLCPPTYTIGERTLNPVEHSTVCVGVEVGVHIAHRICPSVQNPEPF